MKGMSDYMIIVVVVLIISILTFLLIYFVTSGFTTSFLSNIQKSLCEFPLFRC